MKNNDILKKYQRRVKIESIIKSIIYGLITGFIVLGLSSVVMFIFGKKNLVLSILFGVIGLIGGAIYVYFAKFKPSINNVAKRIDQLGLQERVVTMIDYAESDSLVCVKQREDTQEKLSYVESNHIKFRFSKKAIALLMVVALLGASSLYLPDRSSGIKANSSSVISSTSSSLSSNSSSSSSNSSTSSSTSSMLEEDIDEMIRKMIEQIRKIINDAEISDASKAKLHLIVDDLEVRVFSTDDLTTKINMIKQTKADIQHMIELMKSVSKCLQENEATKEFGQAIANASNIKDDKEEIIRLVNQGVDSLIAGINNSSDPDAYIQEIINSLNFSIEMATEEHNTDLMQALTTLRDNLVNPGSNQGGNEENQGGNQGNQGGGSVDFRKRAPKVENLAEGDGEGDAANQIEDSRQEIIDALMPKEHEPNHPDDSGNQEQNPEDQQPTDPEQGEGEGDSNNMDEVQEEINGVIDETLENLENQQSQGNQGNEGGGNPDEGTQPPTIFDDDNLESDMVIDGKTPYLDYLDEKLGDIMDSLTGDELPEDIRQMIEDYLNTIK